jgi:hypothetical protein
MVPTEYEHLEGNSYPSSHRVLLIGLDAKLLLHRDDVLRSAGHTTLVVIAGTGGGHLDLPHASVAVLCHTVPAEQRRGIAARLREAWPRIRIVALQTLARGVEADMRYDDILESLSGPEQLIRVVGSYISSPQAPVVP